MTVRRYETEEVQGEGSYVVLSSLKVGEVRKLRKQSDGEGDEVLAGLKMLSTHILEWNWVDDNDKDLPLPKGKIAVMDELTNEEVELLSELLIGGNEKK